MNVRWLLPLLIVSLLPAQRKKAPARAGATRLITEFPVPDVPPIDPAAASKTAVAGILALTEEGNQWPYEGVYREDRGNLPVGYRIGGTSITIMGLVSVPGYRDDSKRVEAVNLALKFVLDKLEDKRMTEGFIGGYDVRGWGHIYALQCLLHLQDFQLVDTRDRPRNIGEGSRKGAGFVEAGDLDDQFHGDEAKSEAGR